ncbi:MAG: methyltransferase domain-containing protein [Candidatus Azambacteria bacterium]|nr:methyltransferase domain-containing protein [Candidatus Azambacteria bacterium]
MDYFTLTTRGLEEFAKKEIELKLANSKIKNISYRKVIFSFDGDCKEILKLRSVEDVFYFLGEIENVGHAKDSLNDLTDRICKLDFQKALDVISNIRSANVNEFSISSSSVGKRNYSYIEVKENLGEKLKNILKLKYDNEKHEIFDIRIFIEHDKALVGVRLGNKPLHRRSYKVETTKATLQADIAYAMSVLAEITTEDIVLDPMCGSGTILIESSTFNPKSIFGGDINSEAVNIAQKNIKAFNSNLDVEVREWNANKLPFDDSSVNKIIYNLPFGKQIEVGSISDFYLKVIAEFYRVIKNSGKIILLTSNLEELTDVISQNKLVLHTKHEISLNGEIAYIFVIQKI